MDAEDDRQVRRIPYVSNFVIVIQTKPNKMPKLHRAPRWSGPGGTRQPKARKSSGLLLAPASHKASAPDGERMCTRFKPSFLHSDHSEDSRRGANREIRMNPDRVAGAGGRLSL